MDIHWQRGVDEIDAVFTPNEDWEFELFQLAPGLLGYRACAVELSGMMITYETLDQPVRSFQKMRQNAFYAGFVLHASRPVLWKGQEVGPDHALVFGGVDHDMVVPENTLVMCIQVAPDRATKTGLAGLEPGLWSCDADALREFIATCTALSRNTIGPSLGQYPDSDARDAIQMTLLSQLLTALASPTHIQPSRKYQIIHKAEDFMVRQGWDDRLGIDDLADSIGVSRRTVHRSFKDIYGMGPQGFLRLVRLHHFREALTRSGNICVTDAALHAGFEHFGRAAQYYRKQFGELPKQTLKRAL